MRASRPNRVVHIARGASVREGKALAFVGCRGAERGAGLRRRRLRTPNVLAHALLALALPALEPGVVLAERAPRGRRFGLGIGGHVSLGGNITAGAPHERIECDLVFVGRGLGGCGGDDGALGKVDGVGAKGGDGQLAALGVDAGCERGVIRGAKVEGGKGERGGTGAVVPRSVLGANLGGRVRRRLAVVQVVHGVCAMPGLVVEKIFAEATRLRCSV